MAEDAYRLPFLYDLENAHYDEDVSFYARRAAAAGRVLELGCGNGRLTLPMARAGASVVGVDRSAPMLASLAERAAAMDASVRARIVAREGDFTALPEFGRFPLVLLPFNAIHHARDHRDVLALFDGVRRNLTEEGCFVLDCYLPDPELYQRDPKGRYEYRDFDDPVRGERLRSWEESWYDPLAQVHHVTYAYRRPNGQVLTMKLDLRMFGHAELLGLVDLAGFDLVREWSDFAGAPVEARSVKWVLELRARG